MKEFIKPLSGSKKEKDGSDIATFVLRDKIMSYLFEAMAGLAADDDRNFDAGDPVDVKRHMDIQQLINELELANKIFAKQ
jgi:hypothetical protein